MSLLEKNNTPEICDRTKKRHRPTFYISCKRFSMHFAYGATAPSGPGPPHYRDFAITLRHITLGKTPLDERSNRRRDFFLTTHKTQSHIHLCPRRYSNTQSQQASGRRPTP